MPWKRARQKEEETEYSERETERPWHLSQSPLHLLVCCVWHFPVMMGIFSPLLAGVTLPPLSSGLSLHAETHTIALRRGLWNPRTPGPYEIQQNGFYPLKIQYKSSLVLSQLGMSIYLNELSPSSCLSVISPSPTPAPPCHPPFFSYFSLSPPISQLFSSSSRPDSVRFRSFRCLRPLFSREGGGNRGRGK